MTDEQFISWMENTRFLDEKVQRVFTMVLRCYKDVEGDGQWAEARRLAYSNVMNQMRSMFERFI